MVGQTTTNFSAALNTKGASEPKKKRKPIYKGGNDGKASHSRHRGNRK